MVHEACAASLPRLDGAKPRARPASLMDRARAQGAMWASLPTVIQEKILDFVVVGREQSGVVKSNALSPRLVNKMFAAELKYHVDICQTKDPERFVRTALEQARLRSFSGASRPRVEACTADFYSSIYSGVYYFCTTPVTRPPRKDAALYEALLKEMPRELSLVSPQRHNGYLHFVAHAFKYLDRFYVHMYHGTALKTLFRKMRRRLFADYRRLFRRISLVLLTNLAEVRAAAAP